VRALILRLEPAKEAGLSRDQAKTTLRVAKVGREKFEEAHAGMLAGGSDERWERRGNRDEGSRVPHLVAGSVIGEPSLHRLFGRKHLRIGFAEVVASLGLS
jgi:hypothetical protein